MKQRPVIVDKYSSTQMLVQAAGSSTQSLTLHAVKKICESGPSLSIEYHNVLMTLQVLDLRIYSAEEKRKNIAARVYLSDGISRVVCLIPDKVFKGFKIRQFDVWVINMGKQMAQ